jgi:phosphoribosylformylglycinamidine (FGAM) synthase-like enzyme
MAVTTQINQSFSAVDTYQSCEQRLAEAASQNGVAVAGHLYRPRGLHDGANAGNPEDRPD